MVEEDEDEEEENVKTKLTDKEVLAIRWHMGGHHASLAEKEEVLTARQDKLWEVIHRADKLDASGKHKSNEI